MDDALDILSELMVVWIEERLRTALLSFTPGVIAV